MDGVHRRTERANGDEAMDEAPGAAAARQTSGPGMMLESARPRSAGQ